MLLKGKIVAIVDCYGHEYTGRVLTAKNEGSEKDPNWYIEFTDTLSSEYRYTKQKLDYLKSVMFFDDVEAYQQHKFDEKVKQVGPPEGPDPTLKPVSMDQEWWACYFKLEDGEALAKSLERDLIHCRQCWQVRVVKEVVFPDIDEEKEGWVVYVVTGKHIIDVLPVQAFICGWRLAKGLE